MMRTFGLAPSLDEMAAMGDLALETIPAALRRHTEGLVLRVADYAEDEILGDMGMDSPYELLGLYQGLSLVERSISDPSPHPDLVFLYRLPILDYWAQSEDTLEHIVRHVLIHEIGHHFGFSDDDMHALEDMA